MLYTLDYGCTGNYNFILNFGFLNKKEWNIIIINVMSLVKVWRGTVQFSLLTYAYGTLADFIILN